MTCAAFTTWGKSMNSSGITPLDVRVLVKPDRVEEKTKGGIILPDQHKEQQKWATMKGTLVAVGVNAWAEAKQGGFVPPEPGARVMFAKYGGVNLEGADGDEYRIMNDEDVVASLEE